jgi:hypothetical protein
MVLLDDAEVGESCLETNRKQTPVILIWWNGWWLVSDDEDERSIKRLVAHVYVWVAGWLSVCVSPF